MLPLGWHNPAAGVSPNCVGGPATMEGAAASRLVSSTTSPAAGGPSSEAVMTRSSFISEILSWRPRSRGALTRPQRRGLSFQRRT